MAVAMGAVEDVRGQLLSLVRHENAAVRKEAVVALGLAKGPEVVEALVFAARDTNNSVSDAARQSLARHKLGGTSLGEGTATGTTQ
jgi:HEAT repeat protein